MFDLLLMGENMVVTITLLTLIALTLILGVVNYWAHKDDEFSEIKDWEKFKHIFDK